MTEPEALRVVDSRRNPLARARAAKSALQVSDVFRVRDLALAAVVAISALLGALAIFPGNSVREPGPLPRVHAELACAKCHDAAGGPSKACTSCHGEHPSTRRGHRAMAQAGKMACPDCHAQHHDTQGITFEASGAFVKWGSGLETRGETKTQLPAKTTVPLLSLSSCGECHDLKNSQDPAFRCVSRADSQTRFDTCFDEHQHSQSDRFAAWGVASQIAHDTPPVRAAVSPSARSLGWLAFPALASALSLVILRARRKRLAIVAPEIVPLAAPAKIRLPQINASTCVGCYACVDACPFDVLEIQKYVAVVVRPADCCGVILCEQACPNGSLQIAEGEAIETRPNVDAHSESLDAPRVFLAGDLTGLPLIKNAIAQGTRVIDRIADRFPAAARSSKPGKLDVVIVGSGPTGLSAALRAIDRGLSYVILEQATMAASIQSFPRNKLVFDQPLQLPVIGDLWLREATKEELLAQWTRIARQKRIDIRDHHRVVAFDRAADKILVRAIHENEPHIFEASHVVLATGRTGSPRKLDAPIAPDALASVSYSLADARTFAGKKIVIVGLGDSAMEAAIALARQPGCSVTISYRGANFGRGKSRNISEIESLVARGKIRLYFSSTVRRVDHRQLTLDIHQRPQIMPFDALLVMIGGTPSRELLRAAGVTWVGRAHENQNE